MQQTSLGSRPLRLENVHKLGCHVGSASMRWIVKSYLLCSLSGIEFLSLNVFAKYCSRNGAKICWINGCARSTLVQKCFLVASGQESIASDTMIDTHANQFLALQSPTNLPECLHHRDATSLLVHGPWRKMQWAAPSHLAWKIAARAGWNMLKLIVWLKLTSPGSGLLCWSRLDVSHSSPRPNTGISDSVMCKRQGTHGKHSLNCPGRRMSACSVSRSWANLSSGFGLWRTIIFPLGPVRSTLQCFMASLLCLAPAFFKHELFPWTSYTKNIQPTRASSGNQTWQWQIHQLWMVYMHIYRGCPIDMIDYRRVP